MSVLTNLGARVRVRLLDAVLDVTMRGVTSFAGARSRCFSSNSSSSTRDDGTTHFGFKTVNVNDKARMVGEVFSKVAERYDIMNDAMSGGMHRLWKDQFVKTLGPVRGTTIVDLAGGTGDVTFRILEVLRAQTRTSQAGETDTRVIVCDINPDMLAEGKRRSEVNDVAVPGVDLSFVLGDAEKLPFEDGSVDALTIAFGLRNVTRTAVALKDINRVLKRGGRFMCMEFSQVPEGVIRAAYDAYSFNVIPAMGKALAGDAEPYTYLVESIRKFPNQEKLAEMMREAGFNHVNYENYLLGVVAVHSGFKP